MKKLILMLSVLFIGIVSVSFVYSCSNKDEDELIINSNNENTTSLTNSTLSIGSNCNADCVFGIVMQIVQAIRLPIVNVTGALLHVDVEVLQEMIK